ncbi:MAG: iron-sulfur cluster assembly accessory protein [Gammaproteobacteria bacterium]|nr:iron-sulfur cluster assembly accessory protein [Gammaproteobacteria bacterium]CAJ2377193.1 MAG: Iron-sulfur cluster insertion protein ErpA [Arenicellales bacterium IbO2]MDA7962232.1 iron-sulfur cluster assembly accessory protein [Gammaproteobacteria bacterium]MDA7972435.1 iron-sulfur cluster assembly accessory protein [Gammaproteobacteria bacterium]MDA7990741.1 iron-sulfur cluster assembly accessory protein [Gammaproteobacteria bacterium]
MSEYNQTLTDADLAVTEGARARIAGLVRDAGDDAEAVRIYVSGGGCGGMNYGMTFAERAEESDCVMRGDGGFQLVVDPVAVSFLRGAQIDFVDDGVNSSFVFNNVFQAIGGSGACGGCGGGAF